MKLKIKCNEIEQTTYFSITAFRHVKNDIIHREFGTLEIHLFSGGEKL